MDTNMLMAGAWGFTAAIFLVMACWVGSLRVTVLSCLNRLEELGKGMSQWGEDESAKEYALRLLKMSPDELEHEIETGRIINRWGREVAAVIEGLRASVPFLR
jgi:hypothetical protein